MTVVPELAEIQEASWFFVVSPDVAPLKLLV